MMRLVHVEGEIALGESLKVTEYEARTVGGEWVMQAADGKIVRVSKSSVSMIRNMGTVGRIRYDAWIKDPSEEKVQTAKRLILERLDHATIEQLALAQQARQQYWGLMRTTVQAAVQE